MARNITFVEKEDRHTPPKWQGLPGMRPPVNIEEIGICNVCKQPIFVEKRTLDLIPDPTKIKQCSRECADKACEADKKWLRHKNSGRPVSN